MSNKVQITKKVACIVGDLSVARIVSNIVAVNVPASNNFQKTLNVCGSVVISSMVGELARKHIDQKIDEALIWWSTEVEG